MQSKSDKYKFLEYVERFFEVLQYVIIAYGVFHIVKQTTEKAQITQDQSARNTAYATGAVLIVLVLLFFTTISFGLKWTEKLSLNLQNTLYVFPRWRRAIISPAVALSPAIFYWAASKMDTELTFKILIGFYFLVVVNAALISIVRDDSAKDHSPLSAYIPRDAFLQDRQGALVKAFIIVEDRLAKKIGPTRKFSKSLIKEAYGSKESKLKLIIDDVDRTEDFGNFFSGAYGLIRNPRHHTLVEDDIYAAASIFAVAELLLQYVDKSEMRDFDESQEHI